ncbi:hypothetical protein AVEN_261437-1 [Araneus ventricosus]|uniref:Uncharacterized protein n=1 Tax=Araneus ventricosus TaxID=182803 RepID=A0A4Y2SJ48_ARAVE|nr:hypothetical protein AVEN_261437-1 [Araneus ventricosus]
MRIDVVSDFQLELLQQFLSFESNMGIAMQEDDTINQHARAFAYMASRCPNDYFLYTRLKEHLSRTTFSSENDVKTVAENWLNGHGRDFYLALLNRLVLRSDKCLNRFGDYVEK